MKRIAHAARGACTVVWCTLGFWSVVSAQGTFPDPNANCPPAQCGQVSPFIPMQSAEAVHMGLVWKRNSSNAQDPVSLQVSGVHAQRHGRSGAD